MASVRNSFGTKDTARPAASAAAFVAGPTAATFPWKPAKSTPKALDRSTTASTPWALVKTTQSNVRQRRSPRSRFS